MAKQLNQQTTVNLAFTADTSKAKAQLQELQKTLDNLASGTVLNTSSFKLTPEIQSAANAAAQLKVQLQSATNVNTGNLDLTKFNDSLRKSGMSLEKYQNQLYQLGPSGEKAFADLARSITLAEVPLRRASGVLDQFWTTMKNTARWQISSSILHGFLGSVQSAYGYAQDLNESLNNIRIVTGQNTEQMAKFAKNANEAAKALSTTTTAYTNAALIYYQQGDSDAQVLEKTDVTTKMANVTGQNAEVVSDQLTAIWNNFNKEGQESYEKYADILTALGAATASSTDEIAGGLEKFASIADMIGLSYEYAASALATITATTRQSEEVVGTALKTIFARIQGLSLGETLDDGTNLNKYSAALEKVGISIFDQNGELKNMDNILNEMGAKWTTISKDQQVALAQTVAGVRQYNQLVSLMDNWDFMQENLDIAYNSEGTLDEQADIYAESWDAASKRVKAAAEDIYDSLLNDEFFIDLNNGLAKVLEGMSTFVDGMGGMKGILLSIGAIATRVFNKQIAEGLANVATTIKMLTPHGRRLEENTKIEANDRLIAGAKDIGTTSSGFSAVANEQLGKNQLDYLRNAKNMTEEERALNQMILDRNRLLADEVIKKGEALQKVEEQISVESKHLEIQAQIAAQSSGKSNFAELAKNVAAQQKSTTELTKNYSVLTQVAGTFNTKNVASIKSGTKEFDNFKAHLQGVIKEMGGMDALAKSMGLTGEELKKFQGLWNQLENATSIQDLDKIFDALTVSMGTAAQTAQGELRKALIECTGDADKADAMMEDYLATLKEFGPNSIQASEALTKLRAAVKAHGEEMGKAAQKPMTMSTALTTAGSAMMAFGQILSQVKGIISVFNDDSATLGEKILALVTGVGMLVPAVMSFIPVITQAKTAITVFGVQTSLAMWQVTLIVAALVALVAIGLAVADSFKAAEKAAKKAREELQTANQVLDDAKNKYEEVIAAIKDYEEATDALSRIRKGTEEWDEAVKKLNTDVLDLIKSYSGLAKYVTEKDGVLQISKEGLDWLKDTQSQAVSTAEINALNAQVRANKTQDTADIVKAGRGIDAYNAQSVVSDIITPLGLMAGGYLSGNIAAAALGASMFGSKSEEHGDAFGAAETEAIVKAINEHGTNLFADTETETASDKIANALYNLNFDELTTAQKSVVEASIENSDRLMDLAAQVEANSEANRVLTEQIAHSAMENNSQYKGANSDTQSAVDTIVANALENVDDSSWSKTYIDENGKELNDKEVQAEYAKLMNWDTTNIGNKRGYGEYNLSDGSTYKVDDTTARYALNQQKKLEEITGEGGMTSDAIKDFAELSKESFDVDNMEEYLAYREKYLKIATETYNLTEKQATDLLSESESVGELAKSYEVAGEMASRFFGIDNPDDQYYKDAAAAMEGLSDEELQIALDVLPESGSIQEFQEKFEKACTEAHINAWNNSAEAMKGVLASGAENGDFSDGDMAALESDDGFINSLKEQGITFEAFQRESYDRQYALVLKYYQSVSALSAESYDKQKEMLMNEKLDKEAQLSALRDAQARYNELLTQGQEEEAAKLAKEFEDTWDIEITADISEAQSELDLIQDKLDELNDKHIEVAIDWDGIDEIEAGMQQTSDFAKMMQNDAKKVGSSYQLTAAQAKEWMKVYPELFNQAEVTNEGLISLDSAYVDQFIAGKEDMTTASIDQKIADLEAEEARLLAEKEILLAEGEAFLAVKNGELEAEQLSAEQLSDLHTRLTKYYIDLGYDEAEANAKALEDMGIDQQTYTELVADAAQTNAENQAKAAQTGATAQADALSKLAAKWKNFVNNILTKAANAVSRALTGEDIIAISDDVSSDINVDDGSFTGATLDQTFSGSDKSDITAVFDNSFDAALAGIDLDVSAIDEALASIQNQKNYLNALKLQGVENLGVDDIDAMSGSKNSSGDKTIEELAEMKERYHEITREIERQQKALDRLGKEADRAYGPAKLALLDKQIDALSTLRDKQEELYNIATLDLAIDHAEVKKYFANADINSQTGEIDNYTTLLREATNQLNTAKAAFNDSAQTDADKEVLENAQKHYDKQIEALEQYEKTLDAKNDAYDAMMEAFYQWQDANYDKLHYKLEFTVDINDQDMKILQHFLAKVEEDVYSIAEGFHLWNDELGPQYELLKKNLEAQSDFYDGISEAYANNDISQSAFIDGLVESEDAILDNLSALKELDDQMMQWYSNTLSLVSDELDYWTGELEHQSALLDHYKDIVTLVNGERDYNNIGTILQGTADAKKDQMEVAEATYKMWVGQEEAIRAQMAGWDKDSEEYKKLEKDLRQVQEKVNDAEIEMLESTQEWAEAMKAVMTNTFDKAAYDLEMAFTDGMGFDSLMNSLDRLSTYQDTFLTKTNQLYETEKLARTAQQAMDKTSNAAAKAKIKNYIDETNALKEKNELSNLELKIQQAKYDVLLAEIALEEAQNAKSTVRLQRDNEGNFGYVYTADQEKISEAEQNLADAENKLYNIRLDGANDNAQKIIELNQKMYDDITALNQAFHVDQTISEEQYNAEMARLREEYAKLYTAYSNDYTTATAEDSRIQDEAWTTAYQSMVEEADDWQDKIGKYTDTCETAYQDYRKKIETESPTIKKLLDGPEGVSKSVKEVTDESENLRKKIVETVVPQMTSALNNAKNKTATYMSQIRSEVQLTIQKYENLLLAMQKVGQEEAKKGVVESSPPKTEDKQTENKPTENTTTPTDVTTGSGLSVNKGDSVTVKTTATNFTRDAGRGTHMQSWVPGSTFTVMGVSGNEVLIGRNGGYTGWVNKSDLEGFRTGGYTGEWGPSGKLALLHEKELILNQEDTKNMLGIVSLVHDIISQIDLRANNQSSFGSFMSSPSYNGGNSMLEQDVHIEAHFPNATNHSEIEEAFGNLINLASQYANRK